MIFSRRSGRVGGLPSLMPQPLLMGRNPHLNAGQGRGNGQITRLVCPSVAECSPGYLVLLTSSLRRPRRWLACR
jgi:hypothetical protein